MIILREVEREHIVTVLSTHVAVLELLNKHFPGAETGINDLRQYADEALEMLRAPKNATQEAINHGTSN